MFSPALSDISQNDTKILEKQQQKMQWRHEKQQQKMQWRHEKQQQLLVQLEEVVKLH